MLPCSLHIAAGAVMSTGLDDHPIGLPPYRRHQYINPDAESQPWKCPGSRRCTLSDGPDLATNLDGINAWSVVVAVQGMQHTYPLLPCEVAVFPRAGAPPKCLRPVSTRSSTSTRRLRDRVASLSLLDEVIFKAADMSNKRSRAPSWYRVLVHTPPSRAWNTSGLDAIMFVAIGL